MTNLRDPAAMNNEASEDMCLIELEDRVINRITDKFKNGEIVGSGEYGYEFAKVHVQWIGKKQENTHIYFGDALWAMVFVSVSIRES